MVDAKQRNMGTSDTADNLLINRIQKAPDIPNLVVEQILRLIATGALRPGDKLPSELEMTRRFGISRISLREAMKLLEAKGFIESQGRKGKFVRSLVDDAVQSPISGLLAADHQKIWELLEVRRFLDAQAAALAAERATEYQVKRLVDFVRNAERMGIENIIDRRESGKLYAEFYAELAEATNNTIFEHLVKSISNILQGALPYSREKLKGLKDTSQRIYTHHKKLVEAIQRRDPEAARRAVLEHIDYIERSLKKVLR
ncbi:MAG TPA: FadR/GntR family transcriptional regulator [Spirochaetota bacterium]|nr:FadR/GntR family transcriptional regulator [Spirochaetota bacterium]HNT10052.1 FadR/GntR family transcriptional regulator [Spirochaetota bacterium]